MNEVLLMVVGPKEINPPRCFFLCIVRLLRKRPPLICNAIPPPSYLVTVLFVNTLSMDVGGMDLTNTPPP